MWSRDPWDTPITKIRNKQIRGEIEKFLALKVINEIMLQNKKKTKEWFKLIFLIILYLLIRYIIAWITYYNNLDTRLGDSTWRFTYDYPVVGERDISDLDDKDFVRLRRKKNKVILLMYSIVLIMFIASMSLLSKFLLFFTN